MRIPESSGDGARRENHPAGAPPVPAAPRRAPAGAPAVPPTASAAGARADGDPAAPVAACPACGGPLAGWRTVPSGDRSLPGPVVLVRCVLCRTAVTDGPPPRFAAAHDGGSYATRRPRGARIVAPLLRTFDRQRLGFLTRHRAAAETRGDGPRPRLLDVGAGRGRFVATAREAGWDAEGIEPADRGVEAAADAYGVSLRRTSIDAAEIDPGSVDAATLWHVLEHLDQPGPALRRIAGWLRPGGLLLVGVPNRVSLQARIGGSRWYHLDVPRHRTHFTPTGLERLATACGLEVVAVHQVLLEHNPFGLWQSLINRLTGSTSHLYYLLKRAERPRPGVLAVTLLTVPLLPALVLIELAAGLVGRGGTMVLVARRPR